jgi:two-component system sensor histidine kinase UhpB
MKTLDSDFQVTLFRIIQEQINNILKHSAASSFQITLAVKKENLHLLIQDNGKGMDAKSIQKGLGLQNIFNRVEWHNGTAEINTGPGEGFRLMIEIPCPLSKHL